MLLVLRARVRAAALTERSLQQLGRQCVEQGVARIVRAKDEAKVVAQESHPGEDSFEAPASQIVKP